MKANLKRSKEISKFELGWESTKESKQGKQKIERWNVYNLRRLGLGQDLFSAIGQTYLLLVIDLLLSPKKLASSY